ncbi:hypothetical protein M9Y10_031143 [Tritrichomonas musculus]|uniref:Protein kinase domain-containing protein n=1 Tax=Tritrichomonas musculus TaxID=1915356 RepID=A0ABR2H1W5_9EUKA
MEFWSRSPRKRPPFHSIVSQLKTDQSLLNDINKEKYFLYINYLESCDFNQVQQNESTQIQSNESIQMQSNESTQMQSNESIRMQSNESTQIQSNESIRMQSNESIRMQSNESTQAEKSDSSEQQRNESNQEDQLNFIMNSKFLLDINLYEKVEEICVMELNKIFKIKEKSTGELFAAQIYNQHIEKINQKEKQKILREIDILSKCSHNSIVKFI